MFTTARLKLTAWYLLIIMLISISFSMVIYTVIHREYLRIEQVQRLRQQRIPLRNRLEFDELRIAEAQRRLELTLILVNLGILGVAGLAGYFLAGRTLRPIKEMIDEQNRFITDSSHELRTPLTSLKSEIEVSLRDKKMKFADVRKLLQSNLEEVNKLQYLSDNLIKLTQFQKGNGNITLTEVSLPEVVGEAVKKVTNLAKHKNITIKKNIKSSVIEGDRQSLIEVFVIFLDNAIKYSSKNTTIHITSNPNGHPRGGRSVVVNIKDQGVGIAKEDLPHLFDRFYRADKSRTETSGYGLGLSIAKQIVEKHHGKIEVESDLGAGTTFSIYLSALPS